MSIDIADADRITVDLAGLELVDSIACEALLAFQERQRAAAPQIRPDPPTPDCARSSRSSDTTTSS